MRLVIVGPPGSGKTSLAETLRKETGIHPRHTDELVDGPLDWSAQSAEVASWMASFDPFIIEGVTAVRALRKALAGSVAMPCDKVIFLQTQHRKPETKGAASMTKAVQTIWEEIKPQLIARGVKIEERT
jgi:broad-specificity NMP kinase